MSLFDKLETLNVFIHLGLLDLFHIVDYDCSSSNDKEYRFELALGNVESLCQLEIWKMLVILFVMNFALTIHIFDLYNYCWTLLSYLNEMKSFTYLKKLFQEWHFHIFIAFCSVFIFNLLVENLLTSIFKLTILKMIL